MAYITHITLSTGHTSRIKAGDVSGETLARVSPWLLTLVDAGRAMPLPVSSLREYTAHAAVQDGALVLTVSGPTITDAGQVQNMRPPVVTIGVAKKSRHAHLWRLMTTGQHMPQPAPGIKPPETPWCAVSIWPSSVLCTDAFEWLGDFERCVAWAWCHDPR